MVPPVMRFGYALGRILVLEGRLMTPARLERLAHATDLAEQLKVLSETEFAQWLAHAGDRESVQTGIERRVEVALELLEESRAGQVARFFRITSDFTNIKVALAREGGDAGLEFVRLGTVSPDAWGEGDLPPWLGSELEEARAIAGEEGPAAAAAHVDRRRLAARLATARDLDDGLAVELARLDVDMANARMAVRGATDGFIEGGVVAGEELAAAYVSGGLERLAERLTHGLPDADGPAAQRAASSADFLEVVAARTAMALARQGRLRTTTGQPVVAWMTHVEAEARLVALVVLGGIDGVPVEAARERVQWAHG